MPEILQFPANAALVLLLFAHQADTLGKVATVGAGEEAERFQLPEFLIRCAGLIGEPVRSQLLHPFPHRADVKLLGLPPEVVCIHLAAVGLPEKVEIQHLPVADPL